MNEIKAFKCSYCAKKIYESKDSCKSHEYRCYFNPRTRSCASCVFLRHGDFEYSAGYSVVINTCLRNNDVARHLKTTCGDFHNKKTKCDLKQMRQIRENYSPLPIIQPILDKYKTELEERLKTQRIIDEESYLLRADALLARLGTVVGWSILLRSEVNLALNNNDLVDDDILMKHFDYRQKEVDEVIYFLALIGIPEERINRIIKTLSEKLLQETVFCVPLCRQGQRQYHEKMMKYCELFEDLDGAGRHKQILAKMGTWTATGLMVNIIFPGSGHFSKDTPDLNSLKIFLDKLSEIEPNLKQDIIEGMKIPVSNDVFFDCPF